MFRFDPTSRENPSGLTLGHTVYAAGVCPTGLDYPVVHKERSKEGGYPQSEPPPDSVYRWALAFSNLDGLGECAAWMF